MKTNSPTAEQIAAAIKNHNGHDRARRTAARLNGMRKPAGRVLEKMEMYKRLGGVR